jgi:arabinofuranosyltransferase
MTENLQREKYLSLLFYFVLCILLCALLRRGTLDDLYITFTYARNFAHGLGFSIWNIGEPPVEGSTSTIWMILLAAGIKLGVSPYLLSYLLSSLSFFGIVALFVVARYRSAQGLPSAYKAIPPGVLKTSPLLLLTYLPIAWYAATGMESTFFAFLLTALLLAPLLASNQYQTALQSTLSILLVLTRPEGLLLAPLICGYFFLCSETRRLENSFPLIAAVCTGIALTLFRLAWFGEIFPNTYYAKAAGAPLHHLYWGARNLSRFFAYTFPAWLIIVWGMIYAWRKKVLSRLEQFLIVLVFIYIAYTLKSGGDPESAFPLWRHFVHIAAIWLMLAACAIERLSASQSRRRLLIAAFIVLTQATLCVKYISGQLINFPSYTEAGPETEFFDFIHTVSDDSTIAAVSYAGHWSWYFQGKVIDLLGLNDKHIAHFGEYQQFGELDSRSDMAYVLNRNPDMINFNIDPAEVPGDQCPQGVMSGGHSQMHLRTLSNPEFKNNYLFLVNAPYKGYPRALFIRQNFLPELISRSSFTPITIPVSETALYKSCRIQ